MPHKHAEFHRLLKARGMNVNRLAEVAGVGRSHLSKIVNNLGMEDKPGRGRHTKPKLFRHLTPAEIDQLGWSVEYQQWLQTDAGKKFEENSKKLLHPIPAFVPLPSVSSGA